MADTAVQTKNTNTLPATLMADFSEHAGAGMDAIGTEDMQIPFLRILQPLSPQINKNDASYIKGASSGDLFNTVTGQFWSGEDGVYVIPCGYTVKYLEFQLRINGGGYQGELDPNDPDLNRTTREGASEILPSGNEVIRSAQHLVMIVDPETGATQQAICDMKKTQLKVSRKWNTQMRMVQYQGANGLFNPPMWGTIWKLTTVQESNDQGTWNNYAVERIEPDAVPAEAFSAAKSFFESFAKGEIKTSGATAEEQSEPKKASVSSDDVPF